MELVLVPDIPTDELIRQVADAEIDITVVDSNIALINRVYHPDIRIAFPISSPQSLAWAVRKGNGELLEIINEFFTRIRTDGTLDEIYSRYHENRNNLGRFDLKAFHRKMETHLPRYQKMIQKASDKHGFDWRLIAAMIYQESHFDPRARSYTGVRGLMQVTQTTAAEMGIVNRMDPEQSIEAGVGYLAVLYRRFDDIENEWDRLLFSLASYNVGYGHVRDAQKIVREHARDPYSWSSLMEVLPLLRMPEFYREARFGYARGTEPVRYVENITAYYDILKRKI
jgi:membrane-bound lytic murein transglycosylase F